MPTPTPEHTLAFPSGIPAGYIRLNNEPQFVAEKHLQLESPSSVNTLSDLGYAAEQIADCPSNFGVSSAFRIFSAEGSNIMRELCQQMYANRNSSLGTGNNRLGSYIRGAGYRSKFIRDFCDSPELASHLSKIAGIEMARHSVPAVACGVNYAPQDINRAVDSWHTDSVAFDMVIMLSDPEQIDGGEFQFFHGTKQEGETLLGVTGEQGGTSELPAERVQTIPFPAAGFGFMQQGNMIFHRACKLNQRCERITMIPSFVVTPATANDATNSVNMSNWDDPGIVPELTRHEAWRAGARLGALIDDVQLDDDAGTLLKKLELALGPLQTLRESLEKQAK